MPATDVRTALAEKRKADAAKSWWGMIKATFSEFVSDNVMTWSAAVTCYTLLSLAPLLVVAIKVLSVVLGKKHASGVVSAQAQHWMGQAGSSGGKAIQQIIAHASTSGSGALATALSLVVAVISATGVFAEVQAAMNRIWKVKQKAGGAMMAFVRARALSLLVLILAGVLMLSSVFATSFLSYVSKQLGPGWRPATWIAAVIVTVGVLTLLFAMLFRTLPDAEIPWHSTWVGAVITAVLFEIGQYAISMYFRYGAPTSAFGAAGSLAAVLIWVFYSSLIVFLGAEFTYVYAQARGDGIQPSAHARSLTKCDETESATTGDKPPPPRSQPVNRQKRREMASPYGAVLSQYVPRAAARPVDPGRGRRLAEHEATVRSYLAAGAGLALGALIGGYGALHARRAPSSRQQAIAAERLDERIRRVRGRLYHAASANRLVQREDAIERIERLECDLHAAAASRRPRWPRRRRQLASWMDRAVQTVRSYF